MNLMMDLSLSAKFCAFFSNDIQMISDDTARSLIKFHTERLSYFENILHMRRKRIQSECKHVWSRDGYGPRDNGEFNYVCSVCGLQL